MSRYRSISVDVEIYVGDFDDDDLVRELRDRGFSVYAPPAKTEKLKQAGVEPDNNPPLEAELAWVRAAIVEGRKEDALAAIDRLACPRFKDIDQCKNEYASIMKPAMAA